MNISQAIGMWLIFLGGLITAPIMFSYITVILLLPVVIVNGILWVLYGVFLINWFWFTEYIRYVFYVSYVFIPNLVVDSVRLIWEVSMQNLHSVLSMIVSFVMYVVYIRRVRSLRVYLEKRKVYVYYIAYWGIVNVAVAVTLPYVSWLMRFVGYTGRLMTIGYLMGIVGYVFAISYLYIIYNVYNEDIADVLVDFSNLFVVAITLVFFAMINCGVNLIWELVAFWFFYMIYMVMGYSLAPPRCDGFECTTI